MAAYVRIQATVYEYTVIVVLKYKYAAQYGIDAFSPNTMNCKGISGNAIAYHAYRNKG